MALSTKTNKDRLNHQRISKLVISANFFVFKNEFVKTPEENQIYRGRSFFTIAWHVSLTILQTVQQTRPKR